jgi:hypothetical protein
MRRPIQLLASAGILICAAGAAGADVTISSAATQNMSCSNGVCAPTATSANLNVGDLETYLASGNVEVTTTGSGVEANDIAVSAAFSWSAANSLALDAHRSMTIGATIANDGAGGIGLTAYGAESGGISYVGGNITFAELSSTLTINGHPYTLADSIKSIASDIASSPNGRFALANYYDASGDGTYTSNPIPTVFVGIFDGLGNAISNLSITDPNDYVTEGLFLEVGRGGRISDVALTNATFRPSVAVMPAPVHWSATFPVRYHDVPPAE